MRVVSRPLAPGETDYELIGVAASVVGFGLAACWFVLHLPWPICLFHAITGVPCLTCGATRSAIALSHAQFVNALKWNPLACLAYCGIAFFDIYAFGVLATRATRLRAYLTSVEKRTLRVAAIAVLLTNWIYLLAHSQMYSPPDSRSTFVARVMASGETLSSPSFVWCPRTGCEL
jgi:Protein of unknown function (DUF2752)